jgi:hypothetical protein
VGAAILFGGSYFIDFFTEDVDVRNLAKKSLLFLSIFCFFDAIQGVISGILRGAGKQIIGAIFNICAFYVIGLPLAYYFCFHTPFGVNGLMLGISGGVIFQDIVCFYLIGYCENFVFPMDIDSPSEIQSKSAFTILNDEDDDDDDDESNIDDSFTIAISNYDNDNNENNNDSNIKVDKVENNVKIEDNEIEMTDI